jgi:imidazolonepropionase-like amidohydrolase
MSRSALVTLLSLFLSANTANAAPATPPPAPITVLHVGHLIADPAQPVRERQSVLVQSGKITAIKDGYVAGDSVVDLKHAWVVPGLIDMHTHVTIEMDLHSKNPIGDFMPGYIGRPVPRAFASAARAQSLQQKGFTTLRNLGDPANITYDLAQAIAAGQVPGPRLIGSEPQFETAGGDYAPFNFGGRADVEPLFKNRGTCAGATDCERVVRDEIRRGAGVIKMRLSAMHLLVPGSGPTETAAELNAIVSTAHRLNRKVATHSSGLSGANLLAIEAGTDTLEHGPVSDADIAAMAARGTAYTPTLLAAKLAGESGALGPKMDYLKPAVESVRKAHAAGIPLLFGSDVPVVPFDGTAQEFLLLASAGLKPAEVLATATTNAAKALGMEAQLGTVAVGKLADMVAFGANPLSDLNVLASPVFVMQDGKVVRNDAVKH